MARAPSAGAAGAIRGLAPGDVFVLRLAFGATLGFAIAMVLDWQFSFLAPMLAVQMLAAMPSRPGLRQGLAIPLVIFVSTTAALTVVSLFSEAPVALLTVVGFVIFATFYGQRRGGPAIVMLLFQIAFCGIPLLSTESLDLAHTFAEFLRRGSLAAAATLWISHALFPAPPAQPAKAPARPVGLAPAHAARVAMTDVLVLLPLLVNFMISGDTDNIVILIVTINLLREVQPQASGRVAMGLLAGNILGGGLALVAQQYIFVADNLVQFLLVVFLAGLWFASRMIKGGPAARIFSLAFTTFLLMIGLAITPLPGGSGESVVIRIVKIGLASCYALGALSLLGWMRSRPRVLEDSSRPGSAS